jgi:hypothetical protein
MSSTTIAAGEAAAVARATSRRRWRYFFVWLGLTYAAVAVAGFAPIYLRYFNGAAQIHWFAHLHGALMSSWLLLYITQALLAASGSLRRHRTLGAFGIALAVLIWLSMCIAPVRVRLALNPPPNHPLWGVFALEIAILALFSIFFVWGIRRRQDGEAHKRLMTLATAVLLQAAIDRNPGLRMLVGYSRTFVWLFPVALLALIAPLIVFDRVTLKRIHSVTLIGIGMVLIAHGVVFQLRQLPAWRKFAYDLVNILR